MKNFIFWITLFLFGVSCGWATMLRVPVEYIEISQALDAASNGDTVMISPGDYTLSDTISSFSIVLASRYILSSDTADIISTRISNEDFHPILQVDLDGHGSLKIIGLSFQGNGQDVHRAMTISGQNSAFSMDHCIVSDFNSGLQNSVFVTDARSIIACCRFLRNTAHTSGGALGVYDSALWLHHCIFDSNSSYCGGAVKLENVELTLENNVFRYNEASYWAGAVDCEAGQNPAIITRNLFLSNSAVVRATAAYIRGFSSLTMTANNFSENHGTGLNSGYGALMVNNGETPAYISGNLFKSNSCTGHVGAISLFTDTDFYWNLVRNNTALNKSALYLGQANLHPSRVLVRNCLFSYNVPLDTEYEEYAGAVVAAYPNDTLLILDNDFIQNDDMAVGQVTYNENGTAHIEAFGNYWGHASGPYHATMNPGGQGDAVNPDINVLPFSPTRMTCFTVPDPFDPVYPANGSVNDTLPVRFSWSEAYDQDPVDHIDYKLEISEDGWFSNPREYFFINNTSFVVQDLEPENEYYWRVTAYDMTWQARTTVSMNIHITDIDLEPWAFSLESPQNLDWVNPQEQVFCWKSSYDFTTGDCVRYELQVADNNTFYRRECFDAGLDTSYVVSDMSWDAGQTYYWRVLAYDMFEHRTFSNETWTFQALSANETEHSGIPEQWGLTSLYPNPFNATLKVEVAIPENSILKLEIVNLLGQTVAVLMNETVLPGRKMINWHSDAPSGVYFLRCSSSTGWHHQQRVILVR